MRSALVVLLVSPPSFADVYLSVGKDGVPVLSDRPSPGSRLLLRDGKNAVVVPIRDGMALQMAMDSPATNVGKRFVKDD